MRRPLPPERLRRPGRVFEPAPRVADWLTETFIAEGSPLENERYQVLREARIGVLWTNAANSRQGRATLGTAEIPIPRQGAYWTKARITYQLEEWFGKVPTFLVTLFAPWCATAPNDAWCALVEHELHHCGQAVDQYGSPRFHALTGAPLFAILPHDVEEFVGVIARYGTGAVDDKVAELVEAAKARPTVARRQVAGACGTCRLAAA